jgi:crotonobetainyl-CoA:carnitine CoA-transferase CaiB-like acyl-CoA transferase
VPAVGEHTDAILAELGLDEGQITRLRQAGTI